MMFVKSHRFEAKLTGEQKRLLSLPLKFLKSSERKNQKAVQGSFIDEWRLYDELSALLLMLLIHIQQKDEETSPFEEALLLLGYKILSHMRSIKAALNSGWHGTAHSILSLLTSDLHMLMYLGFKKDLIKAWASETQDSYQNDRKFQKLFSETTVSNTLKECGIEGTYEVFRLFRKTTHGSYWGTQVYTVDMRLSIPAQPPDLRISLATIGFSCMFVAAMLHWLLMDQPSFGSPCKAGDFDSFRGINKELMKSTTRFAGVVMPFLEELRKQAESNQFSGVSGKWF